MLLVCLDKFQVEKVLKEMHGGVCGGHYSAKTIASRIIRAGYYWPTLFKDDHKYVQKFDPCQRFSSKLRYASALPLNYVTVEAPFVQWGIDFIGEIIEKSSRGHKWFLVATNYFTKWIEAIPTKQATSKVVINFLIDNIVTKFGVPAKIVMDNAMCFRSEEFVELCANYGIIMSYSSPYHPQGNDQAESSNKSLFNIIKKILEGNKRSWDQKLKLALWADRVTIKKAIGISPFELVYGVKAMLPVNNLLPVYQFLQIEELEMSEPMEERMIQLVELEEMRTTAHKRNMKLQLQSKYLFDKRTSARRFQIDDMVLQWNTKDQDKGKHKKFESLWIGPLIVCDINGKDSYFLQRMNGEVHEFPMHGQFLKYYFS